MKSKLLIFFGTTCFFLSSTIIAVQRKPETFRIKSYTITTDAAEVNCIFAFGFTSMYFVQPKSVFDVAIAESYYHQCITLDYRSFHVSDKNTVFHENFQHI